MKTPIEYIIVAVPFHADAATHDELARKVNEKLKGGYELHGQPFFSDGGSFWTNSTTNLLRSTTDGDRGTRTRNRCHAAGYESVALTPLRSNGDITGLLQLNNRRGGVFTPPMIRCMEEMGRDLGEALRSNGRSHLAHPTVTVAKMGWPGTSVTSRKARVVKS